MNIPTLWVKFLEFFGKANIPSSFNFDELFNFFWKEFICFLVNN